MSRPAVLVPNGRIDGTIQDSRMFLCVLASIVMCGYDAIATMQLIGRGIAAEGNPLMASLIQKNALLFFLVKMAVTALGLLVCYTYSHVRTARVGIRMIMVLYACLCTYHFLIIALD